MAFFAREPTVASFSPLFRLLDDFDTYSRANQSQWPSAATSLRAFQPKFDVRELPESYELHGELPGVDQANVEIEFTEPQVLSVRGRAERSYTSASPAPAVEEAPAAPAIDAAHARQPSVEEAPDDNETATVNTETTQAVATPATSTAEVVKRDDEPRPQHKYWVSERSVGQFARSFSFPVRVDQDSVHATMHNGILTIVVPKAKPHTGRKITIQ